MDNYENEELRQDEFPQENAPQEPEQPVYEDAPYQQPVYEEAPRQQPVYEEAHRQPPVYEYSPYQQPYHGAGAGRKESPFANSPYEMNRPRQEYDPYRSGSTYVPPVPPQKPRKEKKQRARNGKAWKVVLCVVLALGVVAGSCGITAALINNNWENRTSIMQRNFEQRMDALQAQIDAGRAQSQIIVESAAGSAMTPGAVYQKNMQSVVLIKAQVRASNMFGQSAVGTSSGSGFILSENGYVATNHHVVDGATKVNVIMHDGPEYTATLIGSDDTNDVALLKINEDVTLQPVEIGSSDELSVGDQVIAIGNPLGELTSTLTVGYVSAKERSISTEGATINMIQTDAAINSGNSGGPLFNAKGQVVGITTAKFSGSSSSGASIEGIGFAIPINDVMPLIDDLMNFGYITSAYLGVMVNDVDAATASYYGLPVGAYVQEVISGYCAEAAGLRAKDIITAVGSYKVESHNELVRVLRKFKAGEATTVTVYRGGQELVLPITLDAKPPEESSSNNNQMPQEGSYDDWYNYFQPFFNEKG